MVRWGSEALHRPDILAARIRRATPSGRFVLAWSAGRAAGDRRLRLRSVTSSVRPRQGHGLTGVSAAPTDEVRETGRGSEVRRGGWSRSSRRPTRRPRRSIRTRSRPCCAATHGHPRPPARPRCRRPGATAHDPTAQAQLIAAVTTGTVTVADLWRRPRSPSRPGPRAPRGHRRRRGPRGRSRSLRGLPREHRCRHARLRDSCWAYASPAADRCTACAASAMSMSV